MAAHRPKPNNGIMAIEPYVGGESNVAGRQRVIKLSSNEGALGTSPKALAAYRKAAAALHRYPDGGASELRQTIGRTWGVDPSRVVCGAGSDELIGLLCRAYAGPGDEVLYSRHGFLMYPIAARAAGAKPVAAPERGLKADVDALLAKVTAKTRILFLANPNNPTGSYLTAEELHRLHAKLPSRVLMVIDAAYAEYVGRNDYTAGIELVDKAPNVVMTRTFSKIFALGGIRLGWAYCPSAVADVLNRVRNPFNVSGPAMAAGTAALRDRRFTARVKANNDKWLPWTAAQLTALGLTVLPSAGNFILVRFPKAKGKNAAAADAQLKKEGIIVRRMDAYKLPDCLRVTIGRASEMKAFVRAVRKFLEKT